MVRAIVVLRQGAPGDALARELQEHCKRVAAPYKFPRIVEFADAAAEDRQREDQAGRAARGRDAAERPMRRSPRAAFAGIFVVTLLSLMAVGAVLPVLPHYVRGPLDSGNFAVGVVVGAFAFTGLAGRPLAGRLGGPPRAAADGRRSARCSPPWRASSTSCPPGCPA